MSTEDRLRAAIRNRTSHVEPSADALHRIEEKLMDAQPATARSRWIAVGAVAAAAAIAVVAFAVTRDDEEGLDTAQTTTTTEGTTTSEATTTTTGSAVDASQAVFPDPTSSRRFDDPQAAVLAFVTDVVGMTDPQVGDLMAGDARSGEIEVRAFADADPTVVLVRQLQDDTWFVIGAGTESIQPSVPEAGATITSPQALEGQAYAFEGTVGVRLYADGTAEPIATTFVTGRGDGVLGDYSGALEYTTPAGAELGVLLYTSEGGEDAAPIYFAAVRVRFG